MKKHLQQIEDQAPALKSMGVVKIGLFGSVLRPDEFRDESDIDVYVVFDNALKTVDNYFAVYDELEKIFQRKVDLVTDESLSPYIGPEILRDVEYARLDS